MVEHCYGCFAKSLIVGLDTERIAVQWYQEVSFELLQIADINSPNWIEARKPEAFAKDFLAPKQRLNTLKCLRA
jgi:hypothetical protein